MSIFEWLKLGSDLRSMQSWVSSNLFSAESISGGFQVNVSYFGVACILGFFYWRRKANQKKLAKAYAKG